MSNAELFQALGMFQQGVQQAAVAGAVSEATAAMNDIHSNITKEADQRKALKQLSDQTAMRLTGLGASGTQIKSAFDAIAPQQFGSVEQMQIEGDLTGSPLLQQTSANILKRKQQSVMAEKQYEAQLKAQLQAQEIQGKFGLQSQKAGLDVKEVKTGEWQKLDELAGTVDQSKQILKSFNALDKNTFLPRTGPGSSLFGATELLNPERTAFKMQVGQAGDLYQHMITGAGLSDKERAMLTEHRPNESDTPQQFETKLNTMIAIGDRAHARQLSGLKASGRDISGWQKMDAQRQAEDNLQKQSDSFLNQFQVGK